jgi:hypothetical protein
MEIHEEGDSGNEKVFYFPRNSKFQKLNLKNGDFSFQMRITHNH